MDISVVVAGIAGFFQIAAYFVYNKPLFFGNRQFAPNIVTWGIWVFLAALNAASYRAMSGDWVESTLPIIGTTLCVATFVLVLFRKKVSALTPVEIICLVLGVAGGVAWKFGSPAHANYFVQGAAFIAAIPTAIGLLADPTREKPFPWLLWTVVYVAQLFVVLFRWRGQYEDLAYPITEIVICAGIMLLALRRPRPENALLPS